MKFLIPVTTTDAVFVSSSASETDYAVWSGATTYGLAGNCIKAHRKWESVQAGNTNHDPETDDGTWWLDIGPTNRWAMLDQAVGSVTTVASPLSVILAPGVIDSVAVLDVVAQTVRIKLDDPVAGTVYDTTYTLADRAELLDWYDYFFAELEPQTFLIADDLPPFWASAQLTVTLANSGNAACGTLAVGRMIECGGTRYGVGVGVIDYSRKETDDFGVTTVVARSYAKRIDCNLIVDNARLDYVARKLAAARSTPCVWVTDSRGTWESLVIYGYYKDWGINISYPDHSEALLTIEGLI